MDDVAAKPLISVIIPAYNCAQYIAQAIDSALMQDVPLEILVINDQSPDELDEVMRSYEDEPCVRYLRNTENLGAAETRNKGVLLAEGKYVAFLDADDVWVPGKLKKQLDLIEENRTVLCCTARELITSYGKSTGRVFHVKREISYRELLKHNSICCSSVLIRTEVAKAFPMHHADSHEDYIMWLEILQKYGKVSGIDEPLVRYRFSNTGKSGNKLKSASMTFKVYRYMRFGIVKSVCCFICYALNGVWKYFLQK